MREGARQLLNVLRAAQVDMWIGIEYGFMMLIPKVLQSLSWRFCCMLCHSDSWTSWKYIACSKACWTNIRDQSCNRQGKFILLWSKDVATNSDLAKGLAGRMSWLRQTSTAADSWKNGRRMTNSDRRLTNVTYESKPLEMERVAMKKQIPKAERWRSTVPKGGVGGRSVAAIEHKGAAMSGSMSLTKMSKWWPPSLATPRCQWSWLAGLSPCDVRWQNLSVTLQMGNGLGDEMWWTFPGFSLFSPMRLSQLQMLQFVGAYLIGTQMSGTNTPLVFAGSVLL